MSSSDASLSPTAARGGRASTALLRMQADERLVAHVRRGNQAAFEVLVSRYQTRLLAFCRHMLGSAARRDAEDVLQEVFASAYRAMTADERAIHVRPWLYRIARNRCLNHLRRDPMPSVEGMELTVVDERIGTAEEVHQRAEIRQLLSDIQNLPETQRSAILLREIDDLSYEQIAMAMDTTIAAVKSLLVRARMGLAEAAESRRLSCDEVRFELGQQAEGLVSKLSAPARRHVKDCKSCSGFQQDLKDTTKTLAMLAPAAGLLVVLKGILGPLGGATPAGGAAAGGAAAGGALLGGSGGGLGVVGGIVSTKAMTGLAAAVAVTGAAVEVRHVAGPERPAAVTATTAAATTPREQRPTPKPSLGGAPVVLPSSPTSTPTPSPTPTTPTPSPTPAATSPSVAPTTAQGAKASTPTSPSTPAPTEQPIVSTTPPLDQRSDESSVVELDDRSDRTTVLPSAKGSSATPTSPKASPRPTPAPATPGPAAGAQPPAPSTPR